MLISMNFLLYANLKLFLTIIPLYSANVDLKDQTRNIMYIGQIMMYIQHIYIRNLNTSIHVGNCNVPKWKQYMHSKCKLSCGLCGSNTKPPTPATDGPTRPTVRPTRGPIITSRPITQGPGRCRDVYVSHCKIFKETGACTKDNWQSYVKKFCRKSCGFCT